MVILNLAGKDTTLVTLALLDKSVGRVKGVHTGYDTGNNVT
jgi:hypothetical protein